jgi:hypothetical protein
MDLLTIGLTERGGRVFPVLRWPAPVAVEALVLGQTPERAVATLGHVFGLCRHAQEAAARLAFGLAPGDGAALGDEILRDALFRLFVDLPGRLGLTPRSLPEGWRHAAPAVRAAVWGDAPPPETPAQFDRWLRGDNGVSALLRALSRRAVGGLGASCALPIFAGTGAVSENSAAGRYLDHPVMRGIEAREGRGPLWRCYARLLDIGACLDHALPAPCLIAPGIATAPATRGTYLVEAQVADGRVTRLRRQTPTESIAAPGGALCSALRGMPWAARGEAALVVSCFDLCLPWQVTELADA